MKKANLILLFALAALSSFGQKIRFSDSTNVWRYYNWSDAIIGYTPGFHNYYYMGDTSILGVHYKNLYAENIATIVFIREDSMSKKVFTINNYTFHPDTTEQLLYDYNLNVGDTFRSNHTVHYVSTLDSVLINSAWHKTWHFLGLASDIPGAFPRDYDIIEGIGCVDELFFPIQPFTHEVADVLTCFTNYGIAPPLSHTVGLLFNNTTSCSSVSPLKTNKTIQKNIAEIYPNPINNTTKIAFPYNISGSLIVLNTIGQAVVNMPFTNESELLIGDKITAPGLYYYRVTDEGNGKVFSGKFVY